MHRDDYLPTRRRRLQHRDRRTHRALARAAGRGRARLPEGPIVRQRRGRGRRDLRPPHRRGRARGLRRGRPRRRAAHASRWRGRSRRCVRPADRRAVRRDRSVERLVPGVPRLPRVALRRGSALGRQAGAGRGLGLRGPHPGARPGESSGDALREEGQGTGSRRRGSIHDGSRTRHSSAQGACEEGTREEGAGEGRTRQEGVAEEGGRSGRRTVELERRPEPAQARRAGQLPRRLPRFRDEPPPRHQRRGDRGRVLLARGVRRRRRRQVLRRTQVHGRPRPTQRPRGAGDGRGPLLHRAGVRFTATRHRPCTPRLRIPRSRHVLLGVRRRADRPGC